MREPSSSWWPGIAGGLAWLSGRGVAARHFAAFMAEEDEPAVGVVLTVEDGLHTGARMVLERESYLIGSDPGCDIVLQDAVARPRHAVLVRSGEGYEMHDLAASPRVIPPDEVRYEDGMAQVFHSLQGVRICLAWPAPEPEAQAARPHTRKLAVAAAIAVLLGGGLVIGTAELVAARQHADPAQRARRAVAALGGSLPAGVRVQVATDGVLEVDGLVADEPARERLLRHIREAGFADLRLHLRSAAALVEQLREALGAPELQIRYDGQGRVRVEGTTAEMAVKARLRDIVQRRARDIDDRVVLLDMREHKERTKLTLPVRITDVMLGEPAYFRSDNGGRYYVGAMLPDGAEVVAIEEQRILFRRGEKDIVYPLQ